MANSIVCDNELIASSEYFWCSGHLGAIPITERSADPRYCRFCFDLLNNEVKILKETRQFNSRASWIPKAPDNNPAADAQRHLEAPVKRDKNAIADADKETHSIATQAILSHRGRGKKSLPIGRIKELAWVGVSARDIAKQLAADGLTVSYRTVSRALAVSKH